MKKKRYLIGGQSKFYYKPYHIEMYNQMIRSVDKTDQILQPHNPTRKSYSWFKEVDIHVVSRMPLNAFILHTNCNGEIARFKNFIISCCQGMLQKHSVDYRKHFEKSTAEESKTSTHASLHQLVQIPSKGKGNRKNLMSALKKVKGKILA